MNTITERLLHVRAQLTKAAAEYGRETASVALLAVSKTRPVEDIIAALGAGQRDFGENYLQDAIPKIQALPDREAVWHFIGPIQSNKTRQIAEHFHWVHSVDRLKIAQRLSDQRPEGLPPLNVCLQVNISQDPAKSGLNPAEVFDVAEEVQRLPGLRLRGLMTIPAESHSLAEQRQPFHAMRELFEALQQKGFALDTLSMGMSDDMEAAIAEGATMVRIGTAIFGQRLPRKE